MALKKEAARQKYLEVFELDTNATDEDIKKAYKRLALKYHPDKNLNDPDATQKFQELSKAYLELTKSNKRDVFCSHCGCGPGCDYAYSDDDEYYDEEDDEWYFESDSEDMDDNVFFFGRIFMGVFSEFIFKRRFQTRKKPPNQRYTREEQEEDSFFDFIFRKYRTPEDSDYEVTEEDLKKFHSYDEWLKSRDPKKRHNHRMRKAKKKSNRKMPGEKPKAVSKKQLLAEQRRREKEMKEIGDKLQSKFQQENKKPKKSNVVGDSWEESRVLKELEVIQNENRKRELEMEKEQKKFEAQERLKEKKKKKKEMKEMKKQVQSEAKKKLQDQEDLKPAVENVESTDMIQRHQDKQKRVFGTKSGDDQRLNNDELFPMGNIRAEEACREKDVKCGLLQQYIFQQDSNNNTTINTATLENSGKGDKSSLLDYHLKQYKDLMKVQPVRHTEQQLKEERTRQKEVQLQRKHQELEKLRDKHKENYQLNAEKKNPKTSFSTLEDEEFERMRKEYLHKQQERERMRNEEELMELKNKRAQTQKWVQKVEAPKWYEKTAPAPDRHVPEPPAPKSNVWSVRQQRLQNMEMMRPRNEMDEESILMKVIEESQRTAELEEQRRKQMMEMERERIEKEKELAAKALTSQPVEKPFVKPKPIESIWDVNEDPPLPVKEVAVNPVNVWSKNPLATKKPAQPTGNSSQPQKSIAADVTEESSSKYPKLKPSFSNIRPTAQLHIPEKTVANDDWDEDLKDQFLPQRSPVSFHQYMKWQPVAKAMLEQQKDEEHAKVGSSSDQLDNFCLKEDRQACKSTKTRDNAGLHSDIESSLGHTQAQTSSRVMDVQNQRNSTEKSTHYTDNGSICQQTHKRKSPWSMNDNKTETFSRETRNQSLRESQKQQQQGCSTFGGKQQGSDSLGGNQKGSGSIGGKYQGSGSFGGKQQESGSFDEDWEDDIDDVVSVWPSTTKPNNLEKNGSISISKCEDHAQHIHKQVLSKVGNVKMMPATLERDASFPERPCQNIPDWGNEFISLQKQNEQHENDNKNMWTNSSSRAVPAQFDSSLPTDNLAPRPQRTQGQETRTVDVRTHGLMEEMATDGVNKPEGSGRMEDEIKAVRVPQQNKESEQPKPYGHTLPRMPKISLGTSHVGEPSKQVGNMSSVWKQLVKSQAEQGTNLSPDTQELPSCQEEQTQNENPNKDNERARNRPLRLPRLPKALHALKRYQRSDNPSVLETSLASKQQTTVEPQKISGPKLVRDLLSQQADPEFLKSLSEMDQGNVSSANASSIKEEHHSLVKEDTDLSESNPLLSDKKTPITEISRGDLQEEVKNDVQPVTEAGIAVSGQPGQRVSPDNISVENAVPQGLLGQSVLQPSRPSGLPEGLPPYLVQAYLQYLNQSSKGSNSAPPSKPQAPAPQSRDQAEAPLGGFPLTAGLGLGGILPVPAMMPFVGLPNPMMPTDYILQQKHLLHQQQLLMLQQHQQYILAQSLQQGSRHSPINGELGGVPGLQKSHQGLPESQNMQILPLTTLEEKVSVNPMSHQQQQDIYQSETTTQATGAGDRVLQGQAMLNCQLQNQKGWTEDIKDSIQGFHHQQDIIKHSSPSDVPVDTVTAQHYIPPSVPGNVTSAQHYKPPPVPDNATSAQTYNPPTVPGNGTSAQTYNPPTVPGNGTLAQHYNPPTVPGNGTSAQTYNPPTVPGNGTLAQHYNPPTVPGNGTSAQTYNPPTVPGNGTSAQTYNPPTVPGNGTLAQHYNPPTIPGNATSAQTYNPPIVHRNLNYNTGNVDISRQYNPPPVPYNTPTTERYISPGLNQPMQRVSDLHPGNPSEVELQIQGPETLVSPVEYLSTTTGPVKDPSSGRKFIQLPPKLQRRQEQTLAVKQMINQIHMDTLEMEQVG
ncbi:uncharacterized protein [Argopecten irradians]|uniref:uncharacterized protein isoform X2 n=1 Tax=Argopecten irradians TaxID=31199 RepID=UPI003722DC77